MISRAGRTASAVAAAVTTTACAHLLGTGAAPPVAGLLPAVAVLVLPAWWLTRDERGWERLAGAQLVAQLVGHALFVACAADPAAHGGHGSAAELVLGVHVVSAAVAGAWLRSGERRAVAAARRAVVLLRRLVARLLPTWRGTGPAGAAPQAAGPARRVQATRLRHAIVHRGPPAVCC